MKYLAAPLLLYALAYGASIAARHAATTQKARAGWHKNIYGVEHYLPLPPPKP